MYALAFYREKDLLQVALLHKHKNKQIIRLLRSFVTKSDVKPLYMLASVLKKKEFLTVSGLPAASVSVRKAQVKLTSYPQILKAIPFLAEEQIPFLEKDGLYLCQVDIDKKKKNTDLTFLATKKHLIQNHLAELLPFEIDPDFISCGPAALFRLVRHYFPDKQTLSALYLSQDHSFFLSLQNGKIDFCHPLGANCLFEEKKENSLEHLPLEGITASADPELFSSVEKLRQELMRVASFCEKKKGLPSDLFICGKDSTYLFVKQLVKEIFSCSSPLVIEKEESENAIPIGLALDAIAQDNLTLQFRKNISASEKEKKENKSLLKQGVLASLALLFTTLIAGGVFINEKKEGLNQLSKTVLHEEFVDCEALAQKTAIFEKQLVLPKNPLVYSPPSLLVSDLLVSISNISLPDNEKIVIKNLHYTLTSYPKVGSPKQPYLGKLDLVYSAPSSKAAKIFQEKLLSSPFVDQTKKSVLVVKDELFETSVIIKPPIK